MMKEGQPCHIRQIDYGSGFGRTLSVERFSNV